MQQSSICSSVTARADYRPLLDTLFMDGIEAVIWNWGFIVLSTVTGHLFENYNNSGGQSKWIKAEMNGTSRRWAGFPHLSTATNQSKINIQVMPSIFKTSQANFDRWSQQSLDSRDSKSWTWQNQRQNLQNIHQRRKSIPRRTWRNILLSWARTPQSWWMMFKWPFSWDVVMCIHFNLVYDFAPPLELAVGSAT